MCDVCASRVPGRRSKAEAIGKPTGWPLKFRLIEVRVAIALCTIHYLSWLTPPTNRTIPLLGLPGIKGLLELYNGTGWGSCEGRHL